MRIATALLSCLLIASAGSTLPDDTEKPSRELTAGGGPGAARMTPDDDAAWSEGFEYGGLMEFSLMPSPWRWQQLKGRPAQPGERFTGSVVEQGGDDYLILNTKCAKGLRLGIFPYCVKKKENYINFRRPFDKKELNQKDCCGGKLVTVIQR